MQLALDLKTFWNPHVQLRVNVPIQEGHRDVHCLQFHILRCCQGHDCPYCCKSSCGCEDLTVVHPRYLAKPLCHHSPLILIDRAIRHPFHFKHPPASNCAPTRGELGKFPHPILDVSLNLAECCLHPLGCIRVFQSLCKGPWFRPSGSSEHKLNSVEERHMVVC